MKTIVKVQTPLASNQHPAPALVYDRERTHLMHVEITADLLAKMRGAPKAFFHAEWMGTTWMLGEPAPWQPW